MSSNRELPVSLILTVRNEEGTISTLLASLQWQTVQPAEIVIVDGGSTDGTQEKISSYTGQLRVKLIEMPGANISEGRNAAIRASSHNIIAATDAGVRLHARWLEAITEPLLRDRGVDVVSGFFVPDPQTPFEEAMGATVLPSVQDIDPGKFLPSSRSIAFRKEAWERVGGYPEWLDYCEDLVFDMKLKEEGFRFTFKPEAVARFRPRSSFNAFFRQYYRYARGDGKANLFRKRHAIRYATYVAGPLLASWGYRHRRQTEGKLILAALCLAGVAYCRRPYARLLPMMRGYEPLSVLYALILVPLIRLVGDIAKLAGYPPGVWWRIRNR